MAFRWLGAKTQGVERERELRDAVDRMRETLNVELVLRSALREAVTLLHASRGMLILRAPLEAPRLFTFAPGDEDVGYARKALGSEIASLVERAKTVDVVEVDVHDALGRMTLEALGARHVLATALRIGEPADPVLVLSAQSAQFAVDAADILPQFAEQAAIALRQARLFERLGEQHDEIVRQRDEIARRGNVIRDIVYALAHDLRTPLAAADATMKQALAGAYGELPEEYQEVLRTTLASNDDERRLLETLLLVARYESGELSTASEPVDCNALMLRVAHELRPVAAARGVTLSTHAAQESLQTRGDPSELRRAVVNLAANALAASPPGGNVLIETGGRNGHVVLTVQDDGYGISPEQRTTLFERFAARGPGGGTGLGLYIVRRIAEKHGGSVSYAPRENKGSTFTLTLRRDEAIPS